jgi:hypothetical protein
MTYTAATFQPIENAMDNLPARQNTSKKAAQMVRMEILQQPKSVRARL